MDIFEVAFIDLWKCLNKFDVRFIIVGGFAVNFHGFQRYTGDIDLYIEDTLENRKRFRAAYADYGMGDHEQIETIQFVPGWIDFPLANGIKLDIQTSLKGVDESFEECFRIAPVFKIEDTEVHFLHLNHLLANKKAVMRSKDQLDVIELEKISKIKNGS
jgi:predicted nucleotidyltransferase